MQHPKPRAIHFVSLGCPKNRVDSEVMLGVAEHSGFAQVQQPDEAEVIVVNTCGFIEAAKRESIDTILNLASLKRDGSCQKLIVTGCLSQRYASEMAPEMPEVDYFLGSSDMPRLAAALHGGADRIMVGNPADWVMSSLDPRRLSTRGASAYLKIAEGCNRSCAFCVIPDIRGKQRSRAPTDIVAEATQLAQNGVLELNLVSQDTVAYGRDQASGGAAGLAPLIERLAEIDGIRWLRLHYLYPERLSDGLIELMAHHPKVVPYIDMPLQHAAKAMLRRMRRGGRSDLLTMIEQLRRRIDGLVFRSAFIVGHPGESEAEFGQLCDFVRAAQLDHVGVFQYSDEVESASAALPEKVDPQVAEARAAELLGLQRAISREKNQRFLGRRLEVLVEGASEESEWVMVGRHQGQAPEVDGLVYLSHGPVEPGTLCHATVTEAHDYDLLAEAEESTASSPSPARAVRRLPTVTSAIPRG